MLDIAIGISLVLALFAGLVSGIGEIFAQIAGRRGKVLREGIGVLLGSLADEGKDTSSEANVVKSLLEHPMIKTLAQPGTTPSYIPASNFAAAFVHVLSDGSLSSLRQKLDDRTSHLGKLFGPMLDEANGSMDEFKACVEAQFDATMDRVGGWYKRRSQVVLALVGLVLAVALNVDIVNILYRLDHDRKFASELAQTAPLFLALQNHPVTTDSGPSGDLKQQADGLKKQVDDLAQLGVPIGWQWKKSLPGLLEGQTTSSAVFGWLLAALAATLGAPFWFDAISQLIAVRGTGKKPEDSAAPSRSTSATGTAAAANRAANEEPVTDGPRNDFESTRLTGDDVEALQRALGMPESRADGIIREDLRAALREWQRIKGQPATGRFDEPTVIALLYPN